MLMQTWSTTFITRLFYLLSIYIFIPHLNAVNVVLPHTPHISYIILSLKLHTIVNWTVSVSFFPQFHLVSLSLSLTLIILCSLLVVVSFTFHLRCFILLKSNYFCWFGSSTPTHTRTAPTITHSPWLNHLPYILVVVVVFGFFFYFIYFIVVCCPLFFLLSRLVVGISFFRSSKYLHFLSLSFTPTHHNLNFDLLNSDLVY